MKEFEDNYEKKEKDEYEKKYTREIINILIICNQ